MRFFQRYITLELLRIFAMVLMAITVMLVFVGVFQQASENGLGVMEILQVLPYVVYSLLPFTIPVTMLLTVILVYGRLAGDHEITAAKAAGINVMALLWPSLFLGGILSVGALLLTDQIIPWSMNKIQETVLLKMEKIFLDQLRNKHQFVDPKQGIVITVLNVQDKTLIKPTFRYRISHGKNVTIQAETATIRFDLEERKILISIVDGYIETPNRQVAWIREDVYPFPLPDLHRDPKARHMAAADIQHEIDQIEAEMKDREAQKIIKTAFALSSGNFHEFTHSDFQALFHSNKEQLEARYRLRTEFHSRYALSCSCFFFVLVGSPFSILQAKRQFLTSFIMVFLPVVFLYYPVVLLLMNQCKNGVVNPLWAMWIANVLAAIVGMVLIKKVLQH